MSQELATQAQLAYLKKLGVSVPSGLTKSSASDLIGSKLSPEPEALEILRFFKVDSSGMTQTEARHALTRVMADPANRDKWKYRRATKDQKAIITFFGTAIPSGLNHQEAERIVADLLSDETRAAAWEAEQDRRDRIPDLRETANELAAQCGCRRLSAKLFGEAFESLTAEGLTLDQMEANDCARLFARAAQIDPNVVLKRREYEFFVLKPLNSTPQPSTPQPSSAKEATASVNDELVRHTERQSRSPWLKYIAALALLAIAVATLKSCRFS